jgi:DNA-binding transcriptional MerR regulator
VSAGGAGPHLSIGEVLAQLRDEFPDVTISKIRFLESQGLIDPERTPSGYRKFYDDDLARLRWILYQQKEHFLPLKVIKERLDELPPGDPSLLDPAPAPAVVPSGSAAPATAEPERAEPVGSEPATSERATSERAAVEAPPPANPPSVSAPPPRARPATPSPRRRPAFATTLPPDEGAREEVAPMRSDSEPATRARAELAAESGLEIGQLVELEGYGLLRPVREVDGEPFYDDDALEVAVAAAGFFRRGVEARHLRMYRTFAEREAVLFGQVLMPYVRQRNPEARDRLHDELAQLATLGRRLRTALLRDAIGETLAE